MDADLSSVLGKKVLKFIRQNAQKFFVRPSEETNAARDAQARAAKKLRLPSALVAIFGRGLPDASAILGLPSQIPAGGLKVLGGGFGSCLSLGVLDFVEVHIFYLLYFCIFIIADGVKFVKLFFDNFEDLIFKVIPVPRLEVGDEARQQDTSCGQIDVVSFCPTSGQVQLFIIQPSGFFSFNQCDQFSVCLFPSVVALGCQNVVEVSFQIHHDFYLLYLLFVRPL
jgi:hypothetical protein